MVDPAARLNALLVWLKNSAPSSLPLTPCSSRSLGRDAVMVRMWQLYETAWDDISWNDFVSMLSLVFSVLLLVLSFFFIFSSDN